MVTPLQVLAGHSHGSSPIAARNRYRLVSPRFSRREEVADLAANDAVALAAAVRDEDPLVVFGALTQYDHRQLSVLCVALAAMVPTDRSAADLLGWLEPLATTEVA
jgi:hypothetical protein